MSLGVSELLARAGHLGSLLFTYWTALGLVLAALVWLTRVRHASPRTRAVALVATSLVALAVLASPVVAGAWLLWALVFRAAVDRLPERVAVVPVVALLGVMVVGPVVFIAELGARGEHVREFVAFATNMAALRFWAYFWDRRHGLPRPTLTRYLLAMFFFPTFLNGPVEPPRQLVDGFAYGSGTVGLRRVAIGVGKLTVVALLFPAGWSSSFATEPTAPASALWVRGALLYAWFYLGFSAWSDVAIGLGRLCGRRVQENFARPWLATDPADFWRRWHVSLGLWLRDYVYIPLGGSHRHRALNVTATFAVSALWHVWGSVKLLGLGYFGPHAWGGFLLWGALNAAGVLAARPIARLVGRGDAWRLVVARGATLVFAAWFWIPFFLPPGVALETGLGMLARMLWPFA